MKKLLKSEQGQTAVEYMLLVIVMVTILISVIGIIRQRVLAGQGNCDGGQKSIVCTFERMYDRGSFQYFNLMR